MHVVTTVLNNSVLFSVSTFSIQKHRSIYKKYYLFDAKKYFFSYTVFIEHIFNFWQHYAVVTNFFFHGEKVGFAGLKDNLNRKSSQNGREIGFFVCFWENLDFLKCDELPLWNGFSKGGEFIRCVE